MINLNHKSRLSGQSRGLVNGIAQIENVALFHSLVALTYIALGAAAAFGLPLLSAAVEPVLALFAGAAVLIVGALTHQSIVHSSRGRDIMRELGVVSSSSEAMQRELESTRDGLREIKTQFGGGPLASSGI